MVKKKSPPKPDAKKSILDNPFSQCKSAALRRQKQASDESVNKDGISAQSTKTNARKHNASSTKERSVDKRRKIEGPKTYAIDKILSRRPRASRTLAGGMCSLRIFALGLCLLFVVAFNTHRQYPTGYSVGSRIGYWN